MWPHADSRYERPNWPDLWRDGGPTGQVIAFFHAGLGVLGCVVTLVCIPALFGIEPNWHSLLFGSSLFGSSCGEAQPAANDYLRTFLIVGGATWLIVAAVLTVMMSLDPPRRRSSIAASVGWFAVVALAALITAAVIGPLPTVACA